MGAPSSSGGQSNAHAPVVVSPADLQDEPLAPPAGRREDRGCRHVSAPAHGTVLRTRFVPPRLAPAVVGPPVPAPRALRSKHRGPPGPSPAPLGRRAH